MGNPLDRRRFQSFGALRHPIRILNQRVPEDHRIDEFASLVVGQFWVPAGTLFGRRELFIGSNLDPDIVVPLADRVIACFVLWYIARTLRNWFRNAYLIVIWQLKRQRESFCA